MDKIMSVSLAEAKRKLGQLLQELQASGGQYLIVTDNQVKAVLLSVDMYNAMVERLEDLSDAVELLEAQLSNEPMMPFEEFVKELKAEQAQESNVPA
ncbi:MAG: type II toxin-antitoxin system Phd/YefM family antitoxin [Chloroflexi bacterium]|nr:type II toxin-antitoxin system Phd/YefM family antitoxin [Chloroflexota bacterium]